jgi:hypothetical protein
MTSASSGTTPWLNRARWPWRLDRPRPSPRQLRGLAVAVDYLHHPLLGFADSLMNGWMWRLMEAEAIYRETLRSKGVTNRAEIGQACQPGPSDPVRPGSDPFCSPTLLGQLLTCYLLYMGP